MVASTNMRRKTDEQHLKLAYLLVSGLGSVLLGITGYFVVDKFQTYDEQINRGMLQVADERTSDNRARAEKNREEIERLRGRLAGLETELAVIRHQIEVLEE